MAATELKQEGWHITDAAYGTYCEDGRKTAQQIINVLLDVDLREVGEKSLPEGVNKGKIDTISGPVVMQIQKVRNVAAPKENEESQAAPRLLKLHLTDGHTNCCAVEQEQVDRLSLNTSPGSKIKLKGLITMKHGFLLLNKTNTKYLGGNVTKLVEPWELKRSLAKHTRSAVGGEGGPPQFVPFDQRNRRDRSDYINDKLANNFKSLEVNKKDPEEKKEHNDDFAQQRKATIQEALKGAESKKTFGGGGKPKILDPDVNRLVDMGFPAEEAASALKQCGNNVSEAVAVLTGAPTGGRAPNVGVQKPCGARADRGRGRGRYGKDDEDVPTAPSKPSGPATLFDFLETKIKPGSETKHEKTAVASAAVSRESPASGSTHSPGRSAPLSIRASSPSSDKKHGTNLPPRLQRQQQQQQDSRQNGPRTHRYQNDNGRYNDRYNDSYNEYSSETSSRDSRDSLRDLDRVYKNRDRRNERTDPPRSYNNNDSFYNNRQRDGRISSYNNRQGSRDDRPLAHNDRPYGGRKENERPYGGHQDGGKPYGSHQENRSHGGNQENDKPFGGHKGNDRPYGGHKENDRPYGGHKENDRPYGGHKENDRPYGGHKENDRPYGGHKENDRPYGSHKENDGPYGSRKENDGPYGSRKENDRPYGGRKENNRPYGGRQDDRSYGGRQGTYNEGNSSSFSRSNTTASSRSYPSSEISKSRDIGAHPRGQAGDRRTQNPGPTVLPQSHADRCPPPKRSNVSVENAMNSGPQNGGDSPRDQGEVQYQTDDSSDCYVNGAEDYQEQVQYEYDYGEPIIEQPMIAQQPMQNWQQPQLNYGQPNPLMEHTLPWREGDVCMAKYYEDGLFYNAIIAKGPDMNSLCQVTFADYGNTETCHLSDIQPATPSQAVQSAVYQCPPVYQITTCYASPTAYIPAQEPYQGPITTLEFTATPLYDDVANNMYGN